MFQLKPQQCMEILNVTPHIYFGDTPFIFESDLSDEFNEKTKNELRETPENVAHAIAVLKKLLEGEPDLVTPDTDEFYTIFCRPCKWYPESAFQLLKRCYRFRFYHQNSLKNLVPSTMRNVLLANVMMTLPMRTNDGCRVILFNNGKYWNPKEVSLMEYFRASMLSIELVLSEPKTQVAGIHVIVNVDGLSFSQVTYFTPSFALMVADCVQNCLPCRIKGIHIVNESFIFNLVFAIFKPFIQEKVRKRLHFHGRNRDSLTKFLNRECLPDSVGGMVSVPMNSNIGEQIYEKLCFFEKHCEDAQKFGYTKKPKK